MKVLHLLSSSKFSGAENVACQIMRMFKNTDYEMVYCSPNGSIKESVENLGFKFIALDKLSKKNVNEVIKFYQPDILHAHDMRASYVAHQVCGKIPLISHIHINNFDTRGLSIKSIAYSLAAWKSKHIVWVSRSSYNGYIFSSFFKKKSTILYNVIDLKELEKKVVCGENPYEFDIVYLGRLAPQKNPLRLIHVLELVIKKLPKVKVGIIGSGEMLDEIRKKVKDLNLENNIIFTGFYANPMKILADARAMVMTSLFEGTPMCCLESMGLGTPIVSTPVDGLIDIVSNGENGYLSDTDEELASHLINILTNDELYSRLSNNAINNAKELNDLEKYRSTLCKIYES